MEHSDLILMLDKQQAYYSATAVRCPQDAAASEKNKHGRMLPMRDGITLICGKCGSTRPAAIHAD